MFFVAVFLVLVTITSVSSETHSLTYIYTAFSKPVKLPGIHDFTAMGLLDNRMIDYYDSTVQKKIPKQDWMKERLQQEYWDKGTQSRQSKQQWFKVNIDILMNRMRQTSNDTHILQWMHGCVGEEDQNGNLEFKRGMDMYNYDGEDFLGFDDEHQVWVAAADAALLTKRKWDDVTALKDYTKGYLEKECMEWMNTFLSYSKQKIKSAKPPQVFMFANPAKEKANVVLTCFATGFYPKDMSMEIKRDGRVLSKDDGLVTSGVRPNHDETFQRRDHVEILRTDSADYTCRVIHKGSGTVTEETWNHHLPSDDATGPVIGGAVVVVILIAVCVTLGIVLYKKKQAAKEKPSVSSTPSTSSEHVGLMLPPKSSVISVGNSQTSLDSSPENTEPLIKKSNESLNSGKDSAFGSSKSDQDSESTCSSDLSSLPGASQQDCCVTKE